MPSLRLKEMPELMAMLAQRDRDKAYVKSGRPMDGIKAQGILGFWQQLSSRIEVQDDAEEMADIVGELSSDIDMLRAMKQNLETNELQSESQQQLADVVRLLLALMDIETSFKKWLWILRDRALNFYLSINPAMPSKVLGKGDDDKAKKKDKQANARAVLDNAKKAESPARDKKLVP